MITAYEPPGDLDRETRALYKAFNSLTGLTPSSRRNENSDALIVMKHNPAALTDQHLRDMAVLFPEDAIKGFQARERAKRGAPTAKQQPVKKKADRSKLRETFLSEAFLTAAAAAFWKMVAEGDCDAFRKATAEMTSKERTALELTSCVGVLSVLFARVKALEGHGTEPKSGGSQATGRIEMLEDRLKALESRGFLTYRGVWDAGQMYVKGDVVSHQGGMWHAEEPNRGVRPSEQQRNKRLWTLSVMRGRDGRDAK